MKLNTKWKVILSTISKNRIVSQMENGHRFETSISLYIPLSLDSRYNFFAIFFREPPKLLKFQLKCKVLTKLSQLK